MDKTTTTATSEPGVAEYAALICMHPNLMAIAWTTKTEPPIVRGVIPAQTTRVTEYWCPFCRKSVRP